MELKIELKIEVITPEKASEYLKGNTMNRPLSEKKIKEYARDMVEGNWRENILEPIGFATDGTLLNGQHRLQAVIRAAVPVRMAVVRGADKNDFEVLDTGKSRNFGDVLALCGVKNYNFVGSAIKVYWHLKQYRQASGDIQSAREMGLTNKKVLDEYNSSPDLYLSLHEIASYIYNAGRYLQKSEIGGISAYLIKEKHHDIEKVKTFFYEVADGGKYKALAYLRKRLVRAMTSKRAADSLTRQARRVLLSKAWNLFIKGEDQSQIIYRLGDKYNFD